MNYLFLSLILFIYTGCTSNNSYHQEAKDILHLYSSNDPLSLDPRLGGDRTSQIFIRELFEGLYRLDEKGHPAPALAKSVDISNGGCVYTFKLHPSRWTNGLQVTSKDFEYAWKSALAPDFPGRFSYLYFIIKNGKKYKMGDCSSSEVGIYTPDDETLIIQLEHPAPYIIELLSNPLFSPICKSIAEKNPNWSSDRGELFVTNGPYVLKEHLFKDKLVLIKSNNYWHPIKPKTNILHFDILEDPQTAFHMYEKGDLDWLGDPFGTIPFESIPYLIQNRNFKKKNVGAINLIACNTKRPHLASKKIRKALACAIDRQAICNLLLEGGEEPAFSILPKHLTQATPTFVDHDIVLAQTLFNEGLEELGITKEQFPPLVVSTGIDPRNSTIAQVLQDQIISTLGLQVQLKRLEPATCLKLFFSGEFELQSLNWGSYYSDPMSNLEFMKFKDNGINGTEWENAKYIELLDKADHTLNLQERTHLLQQAEQIVLNDLPLIPFYYHTYKYIKNEFLIGESISDIGTLELKYLKKQ